eukprot:TRINITY_DN28473_c0_g1_i1.p1 TRINITY_DN28473_c0_g1~~TRINITY_DN28473_c0_g1_i1.p1  ORF type:complete len:1684 (+),score=694.99 TRINITY_DN28473_c0_g1_i1:92-5053(+)
MPPPLVTRQICDLTTGEDAVGADVVNHKATSIEGDRFIAVRDSSSGQHEIIVTDLRSTSATRHRMAAVAGACMHPTRKTIALRAGESVQVFDLEEKSRIAGASLKSEIEYMTWLDEGLLALVTPEAVHHWGVDGSEPRKVFDRASELSGGQVFGYTADPARRWMALVCVVRREGPSLAGQGLRGQVQLWGEEKRATKVLDGHAACIVHYTPPSGGAVPCTLLCIAGNSPDAGGRLIVAELPTEKKPTPSFEKTNIPMPFASPSDFPVAIALSSRFGALMLVTLMGQCRVVDLQSAKEIHKETVSDSRVFACAPDRDTGGLVCATRSGAVLAVHLDGPSFVQHVQRASGDEAAMAAAVRGDLPGAEALFEARLGELLGKGDVHGAIQVALTAAPRGHLRNEATLQRFQRATAAPGQPNPLRTYFQKVQESGRLNKCEGAELAKVVLAKEGGVDYIRKLLEEGRTEPSEALGELLEPHDAGLALRVYAKGRCHDKVAQQLLGQKQYQKLVEYVKVPDVAAEYTAPWRDILVDYITANPDGAVQLALTMQQALPAGGGLSAAAVAELFVERSCIKQATHYILESIKRGGSAEETAALQTRVLEINLGHSTPQVADRLLASGMLTAYDAAHVAGLCERAGLSQRAMECYALAQQRNGRSFLPDMKRLAVHLGSAPAGWFGDLLLRLPPEHPPEIVAALMAAGVRQHASLLVDLCARVHAHCGPGPLIALFVEQRAWDPLYRFLERVVPESSDPEVHLRFMEAAARTGMHSELERITRESAAYDPAAARELLVSLRLTDQWPLINVCHRHGLVGEMVQYLLETKNLHYLDQYCCKRGGAARLPQVVGKLIEAGASDDYVSALAVKVGASAPIAATVAAADAKQKLPLLRVWLESRLSEGCTDRAMYTGLAKIYCDADAERALAFIRDCAGRFDAQAVGRHCAGREAALACAAYEAGQCDAELLQLTTERGMLPELADYLTKRHDPELWASVLTGEEHAAHREALVEAVISRSLPAARDAGEVSAVVKALMQAGMDAQLTRALEKLLLDDGPRPFGDNKYLQNLLMHTTIRGKRDRLGEYIQLLTNFDHGEVAKVALQNGLHEEAFEIFKRKEGGAPRAMQVILQNVGSVARARDYAIEAQSKECWRLLGVAQLQQELVSDAIDSFIHADDPSPVQSVVAAARRTGQYGDLVRYLQMAQRAAGDAETRAVVDTELACAYARTERLAELADFVAAPNLIQHNSAGERCFADELYAAARVLFAAVNNHTRLASTLLRLGNYLDAHDAASKADCTRTWKEVCCACVDAGELRLAQMAAQHVIVLPDELEPLCFYFESRGHWEELCDLLCAGLSHARAHVGLFTQLGLLYARHSPDKLMDHLRLWRQRLNPFRLITECESLHLWSEVRFLHSSNEDWDKTLKVMLDHPVPAWDEELCKKAAQKAIGAELCYATVTFYLEEHPELVGDLLSALAFRLNPERVVTEVRRLGHLAVIQPWLEGVQQKANLRQVNDALNELHIEAEDFEALRASLERCDKVDAEALAGRLEGHDLLEMRRVAGWLHRKGRRFAQALRLAQRDRLWRDCIDTAAESGDEALCESLLRHFADEGQWECFAACLCTCYDIAQPDLALELAWRARQFDAIMPYLVQVLRELWVQRKRDRDR